MCWQYTRKETNRKADLQTIRFGGQHCGVLGSATFGESASHMGVPILSPKAIPLPIQLVLITTVVNDDSGTRVCVARLDGSNGAPCPGFHYNPGCCCHFEGE